MNYVPMEAKTTCECKPTPIPAESLTDIMREVSNITADLLGMTHRINGHMFGFGNSCCEKEVEPKCFREELQKTREELLTMAKELNELCCSLGV